jgi:hypothetical protein
VGAEVSAALYSTGLWWTPGRGGLAKLHGREVRISEPPVIGGVAVHAICYVPEVHDLEIHRVPHEPRGDMTPAEVAEADQLLARLCAQLLPG